MTSTSSERFNQKVYKFLDNATTMELKYKLTDPKAIAKDPLYSTLGRLGLIATLQAIHSDFCEDLSWPASTNKLPTSNFTPVISPKQSLPDLVDDESAPTK